MMSVCEHQNARQSCGVCRGRRDRRAPPIGRLPPAPRSLLWDASVFHPHRWRDEQYRDVNSIHHGRGDRAESADRVEPEPSCSHDNEVGRRVANVIGDSLRYVRVDARLAFD